MKTPGDRVYRVSKEKLIPTKELQDKYKVYTYFPYEKESNIELYTFEIQPGSSYFSGTHGENTEEYKHLVEDNDLQDYIIFCGMQKNPYPYFKISDCIILTSEYEGYPVIYTEAKVLGIPIITTNVSDSMIDIQGRYGIVVNKDVDSIKNAMKSFIENGYKIEEKFDAKKFNKNIMEKIEKLL